MHITEQLLYSVYFFLGFGGHGKLFNVSSLKYYKCVEVIFKIFFPSKSLQSLIKAAGGVPDLHLDLSMVFPTPYHQQISVLRQFTPQVIGVNLYGLFIMSDVPEVMQESKIQATKKTLKSTLTQAGQ